MKVWVYAEKENNSQQDLNLTDTMAHNKPHMLL